MHVKANTIKEEKLKKSVQIRKECDSYPSPSSILFLVSRVNGSWTVNVILLPARWGPLNYVLCYLDWYEHWNDSCEPALSN